MGIEGQCAMQLTLSIHVQVLSMHSETPIRHGDERTVCNAADKNHPCTSENRQLRALSYLHCMAYMQDRGNAW